MWVKYCDPTGQVFREYRYYRLGKPLIFEKYNNTWNISLFNSLEDVAAYYARLNWKKVAESSIDPNDLQPTLPGLDCTHIWSAYTMTCMTCGKSMTRLYPFPMTFRHLKRLPCSISVHVK